jgi:hypothetical protein
MIYESEDQLQQDLDYWQKVLRLQDWDVEVNVVRARDMTLENSAAAVTWVLPKRMASVTIMDPIDYPPGLMGEQDQEVSLVHELLHLHYAPFDETEKGSLPEVMLEQSIEAISRALVLLKRQAAN